MNYALATLAVAAVVAGSFTLGCAWTNWMTRRHRA